MITFDEVNHKYYNEFGVEYISVTTILGQFKKPFDTDGHASRVAERQGTTVEAVKNTWKAITVEAQEKGKAYHRERRRSGANSRRRDIEAIGCDGLMVREGEVGWRICHFNHFQLESR